ncbi:hypothetical protein EB061_04695 [bacterium]|jgi:hypothetical protein|nr:hypothetical protein [bacterium]
MYSFRRYGLLPLIFLWACASPPPPKALSPREQIVIDTERARGLVADFQKRVSFVNAPRLDRFLTRMGVRLGAVSKEFPLEQVEVRIHEDTVPDLSRAFSFPGTFVSLPRSFVRKVGFENELAAMVAYELGSVMNRHLAARVESQKSDLPLFGENSVFLLNQEERIQSIRSGTDLLYFAGYDVRGMASLLRGYSPFFGKPGSDLPGKEVEFELREAQRARSELLPSMKPVVRSSEFIQFKKELDRIR